MSNTFTFMQKTTEQVLPDVYRIQYPDWDYRRLANVRITEDPDDNSISLRILDKNGKPLYVSATESGDPPLVSLETNNVTRGVETAIIGAKFESHEIAVARKGNIDVVEEKLSAAREACEQDIYNGVLTGKDAQGKTISDWDSFIDNPNVTKSDAPVHSGGSDRTWEAKTGDEIIKDIVTPMTAVFDACGNLPQFMPNAVALPPKAFIQASNKARASGSDTTPLQFVQTNNPYTQITGEPLDIFMEPSLATAAAGNKGRMVVYRRDPMLTNIWMVMPIRAYPPYEGKFDSYEVDFKYRWSGFELRVPKSMQYYDLIS